MIYLGSFPKTKVLHTIINKRIYEEWTYVIAIGYGGFGLYEHFSGKFRFDKELDDYVGFTDDHSDPDEWTYEVRGTERTEVEIRLSKLDSEIINSMVTEVWEHIIDVDDDQIEIKPEFTVLIENDRYVYRTDDWNFDVIDWISSQLGWGLHWGS